MNALAWIGETRVAQAVQDGQFDNLPGSGKPLELSVRDAALDAQTRLGLELLDRARRLQDADRQRDARQRAVLRLLWARALARRAAAGEEPTA